ncbi:MAG: class I SAM-dependent methyltransferase, partial [Microbacterium sp.]
MNELPVVATTDSAADVANSSNPGPSSALGPAMTGEVLRGPDYLEESATPGRLSPDPALAAALCGDLAAAGYTASAVRAGWGTIADDAIGHGLAGPAMTALAGRDDALAVLARMLFLGAVTARADADRALPALGADGLVALGLAADAGEQLVPTALVRPQEFADEDGSGMWWIASDLDETALRLRGLGAALPVGHVLGVGGASLTLAGLQLPTPAERVLDLGCGCGIQALRARRSAASVIATDVSARALQLTRLNALLNGVDGIQTRLGSLFDPVGGERFDRVVSNPPFVITPRASGVPTYEYRDAGLAGDDLVAQFVSGVGAVLAPADPATGWAGGTAQLLGNWEYRDGADGL